MACSLSTVGSVIRSQSMGGNWYWPRERARGLATEWKKMGSGELTVSAEIRVEISRVLGGARLPSGDALLRAVRLVVQERDALERELADMQEERNAAEDLLGLEQLRELYAARDRARPDAPSMARHGTELTSSPPPR